MTYYGWAGKILRVNMTTGQLTIQDLGEYKEYIGGQGIGYKVLFDECPPGTDPLSPDNRLIISVGPFTGTGVHGSGRTTLTFLTPIYKGFSACDGHMGGHFSVDMKYAGFDALIFEGRAASPVYLKIDDDNVSLEPADHIWGKGTHEANQAMLQECGESFTSVACGPAGENLLPYSIVFTSHGNTAGAGVGAVFGSKNLKGIAIRGTGGINVARPQELLDISDYALQNLVGAWGNQNIPALPQSWTDRVNANLGMGGFTGTPQVAGGPLPFGWAAWGGAPSRTFGSAPDGPINLGEQPYWDMTKMAYRTALNWWGAHGGWHYNSEASIVKTGGCTHCPSQCYTRYEVIPVRETTDYTPKHSNSCLGLSWVGLAGWFTWGGQFPARPATGDERIAWVDEGLTPPQDQLAMNTIQAYTADSLGIFENYSSVGGEWTYACQNWLRPVRDGGVVPNEEWDSFPWHLRDEFSPEWLIWFLNYIAKNESVICDVFKGVHYCAEKYNAINPNWYPDSFFDGQLNAAGTSWVTGGTPSVGLAHPSYNGYPVHHPTDLYQATFLIQNMLNRDCMLHVVNNFYHCGLSFEEVQAITNHHWGEGAMDDHNLVGRSPINENKIKAAKFAFLRLIWNQMATVCDYKHPVVTATNPALNYIGDLDLEAKYLEAVTGEDWDTARLDYHAEKTAALLRAVTLVSFHAHFGDTNLRESHDKVTEHWFRRVHRQPNTFARAPFEGTATEGPFPQPNNRFDRDDWETSVDMFYESLGWDRVTGIPTRATLERLELGYVADALEARGLLPHAGTTIAATPRTVTVRIDGQDVSFGVYRIGTADYFRLRDIASSLNGTSKQFNVAWDGATRTINLTTDNAYTPVGGEMAAAGAAADAVANQSRITLNGQEIRLAAYTVDDINYVRMGDVARTIDFSSIFENPSCDDRTILINTANAYTEA